MERVNSSVVCWGKNMFVHRYKPLLWCITVEAKISSRLWAGWSSAEAWELTAKSKGPPFDFGWTYKIRWCTWPRKMWSQVSLWDGTCQLVGRLLRKKYVCSSLQALTLVYYSWSKNFKSSVSWVELGRSLVGFRIKAMREILVFQRFEIDVECVSALWKRVQLIAINCN